MSALKHILVDQIRRFGPISVAEYMTLCLLHPEHGYYTTRTALGADGDFTTAPEISQMFGEMLGLALAQSWLDQGSPTPFTLTELGPGRGSLMADILRVTAGVKGFHEAADIWLIEASPAMRHLQEQALAGMRVTHISEIGDLPAQPIFLVANEFFDALPIRQFLRCDQGWQEQMIGLDGDRLVFGLTAPLPFDGDDQDGHALPNGAIVETCISAQSIVSEAAQRIADRGGAAIVVDYGDWGSRGDSFQAVQSHRKTDPLAAPGEADLTAHVDFRSLVRAAKGVAATGLTPQGVWLERLGITARAEALAEGLEGAALENHITAHRRLTHPGEMGTLFKAIAFHPHGTPAPPGFD